MFQNFRSLHLNLHSDYGEIMEKQGNFWKNIGQKPKTYSLTPLQQPTDFDRNL
jgi:hypothetical protein